MNLAIMQPYFLPYIGYFQLIAAADNFVVYDNIKYTKKGWINRNRFLQNGTDAVFSLPLKKASDSLDVADRELSPDFDRTKLLNQWCGAYVRTPHFDETFALLEQVVRHSDDNLFGFIQNSIAALCRHLDLRTRLLTSSQIAADHSLKAQDKVLAICQELGASTYINPIGGVELYSREDFAAKRIRLQFIRSLPIEYRQSGASFVPWLSIVDVLMFNPLATVREWVSNQYELI